MAHDVSDTEVEPRTAGGDKPARTGQPERGGTGAPPGSRVDATEAEARQLAEAAREAEWNRPRGST